MLETGFTNKFDSAVEAKRVTGLWGVRGAMDNVSPVEMYPGWRVVAIGELTKTNQYSIVGVSPSLVEYESSFTASSSYLEKIPGPFTSYYGSAWASFANTGAVVTLNQPGMYRFTGTLRATNCANTTALSDHSSQYFGPACELRLCGSTGDTARIFSIAYGIGSPKVSSGFATSIEGSGVAVIQISATPCVVPLILYPDDAIGSSPPTYSGVLTACRVIVEYQPFWRNDATGTPTTNGPPGTTVTSPIPLF
jgi:hypothetical protein